MFAYRADAARESHYDGEQVLRTFDLTLTPEDLAAAYKQLNAVGIWSGLSTFVVLPAGP